MSWFAAIPGMLQAAGSLASLFGAGGSNAEGGGAKKAKHHQLDYDRRRIKAIVDGANDAGIHPLAALGAASGGGGFAAPVGNSSGFGIGDSVGAGLSALGDSFADLYESDQDRINRDEARRERQQERAADILRSKEVTPEVKLNRENMALQNDLLRMDIATSRTKLAQARAAALGGSGARELVGPGGMSVNPNPHRDQAQAWENEYGEPGETVAGYGGMLEDFVTGRMSVGPKIVNPLTGGKNDVWIDVPALIRKLRGM